MSKNPLIPSMYWLKSEAQWCVDLPTRKRLGSDRAEAEQRYRRLVAEWLVHGAAPPSKESWPTVAEALLAYVRHREGKVCASQLEHVKAACCAAVELYGAEPSDRFDQISLQAVRHALQLRRSRKVPGGRAGSLIVEHLERGPMPGRDLDACLKSAGLCDSAISKARKRLGVARYYDREAGGWMARLPGGFQTPAGKPLSRTYINTLTGLIQSAWTWAVSQKLAPNGSDVALRTVKSLRKHEGGRETPRRQPVADGVVLATRAKCSRIVSAMIGVQRLTGMRPSEVCRMRAMDISRSPDAPVKVPCGDDGEIELAAIQVDGVLVWCYAPASHKTLWKGKARVIPLGPAAQEILAPFLEGRESDAYLFSPAEASAEWRKEHGRKPKYGKRRQPKGCYHPRAYARAVSSAAARAGMPHWSPYSLRHAAATYVANEADRGVAQALLGHDSLDMTGEYVSEQFRKAARFVAGQERRKAG